MPEFVELHPSALLLDPKNPRLDRIEEHQVEALHRLWARLSGKLLGLAKDIVENGLDPTARLLVIRAPAPKGAYTVLEGNRRVAVLRALDNQDSVREQLTDAQRKRLGTLAAAYRKGPIDEVSCVVFSTREEAERWIELRHTPDAQGAGVVMWGATERARFKDRQGVPELAVQVVDFVREHGQLDDAARQALTGRYITTLRRLLNDPGVREDLGIVGDEEGRLQLLFPAGEAVKTLRRIVTDFATGAKDVRDVYYKRDRRGYLDSLPERPDPKKRLDRPVGVEAAVAAAVPIPAGGGGPRVTGAPGARKKLVPAGLKLKISDRRLAKIYRELAEMKTDEFPNAIAVLLRVFLELSLDDFILKHKLMPHAAWEKAGLDKKIRAVEEHMSTKNLMTRQQLQPVRRALQKGRHMLGASLESLHAYVHNQHFVPDGEQLLASWDDLQPLFVTIWR